MVSNSEGVVGGGLGWIVDALDFDDLDVGRLVVCYCGQCLGFTGLPPSMSGIRSSSPPSIMFWNLLVFMLRLHGGLIWDKFQCSSSQFSNFTSGGRERDGSGKRYVNIMSWNYLKQKKH